MSEGTRGQGRSIEIIDPDTGDTHIHNLVCAVCGEKVVQASWWPLAINGIKQVHFFARCHTDTLHINVDEEALLSIDKDSDITMFTKRV